MESRRRNYLLVGPSAGLYAVLFIAPFLYFVIISFWDVKNYQLTPDLTGANYVETFDRYAGIFFFTIEMAFVIALLATGIIGGAMALSDIFSQSMMQNIVPNEQRGRAMGAWIVGIGTAPVGNLQVGAVIGAAGVGLALSANGIALALVGVAIFALYGRMRRM